MWKYCEKREVFSLVLKDDRVEQCLILGLVGVNSKCGVQSKRKHESHDSCVCNAGFLAHIQVSEEEHSVRDGV